VSRRDQIAMSAGELARFLQQQRVVICATNGPRGWPHLMPLWYVLRDGELWAWTYAKSQKVRNLERDPRATLQVESGEQYNELRGVMIEASVVMHRELELVSSLGAQLAERYGGATLSPDALSAVRSQAAKRVALQFAAQRAATWDHGKLGGAY